MEIRYSILSYSTDSDRLSDAGTFYVNEQDHMRYGKDVQVAFGETSRIGGKEDHWKLNYTIYFVNCTLGSNIFSSTEESASSSFYSDNTYITREVIFTTKKGLPRSSFSSLSTDTNCTSDTAYALQVDRLAIKPTGVPDSFPETPYCAVVREPAPRPSFCTIGIPSISQRISVIPFYQTLVTWMKILQMGVQN